MGTSSIRLSKRCAAIAALALIAASCGSDSDSATTEAPKAETTAAPAAETTAAPAAGETTAAPAAETTAAPAPGGERSVTDYVGYVGSSKAGAADASMAPIKIGYVGQEGGEVVVSATNDDGVDIAAKFINEQAGGIGGHPVEIVKCYIARSDEEGQKCGQQMANDKDIRAIVLGPIVFGVEPFYAAIGNKPVISGVSVNGVDLVKPNAAILYGGAQYILAPYATFARDVLKVKTAALIYEEAPGTDLPAKGQADGFKAAGIDIKVVPFATGTPDLSVALQAAGAADADIVMPVINPPDCVKFDKAAQSLGIPPEKVLASPVCLNVALWDGPNFPKWIYAIASSQALDPTDPASPPFQEILKAQGAEQGLGDPWVTVGFGQMMTVAKFLNAAGVDNLSDDTILAQVKAFKGPLVLGSPVLGCGKYPDAPGVCNDYTQFYQWFGPDKPMQKVGDWVPPPDGWVPSN